MLQLGLDNISNINNFSSNINPKDLICSLCYCININVKQCKNKKCGKLFCGKCYEDLNTKKNIFDKLLCPFCRIPFDFIKVDEILINTINNLKFFCTYSLQCDKEYSYDEMMNNHNHLNNKLKAKCRICNQENSWENEIKCVQCNNYQCENNINTHCTRKCANCFSSICYNCLKINEYSNFLCGFCTPKKCIVCNENESEYICSLCNNFICSDCKEKCETCGMYNCKNNICYQNMKKNNTLCKNCSNILPQQIYTSCLHEKLLSCNECYKKCSFCKKNPNYKNKCSICNINICISKCSTKCKICNNIICYNCSTKCSICKKKICLPCSKFCSINGIENSLIISCKKCNSDAIRKCNDNSCDKNLCLNCWNVCNTCNKIYCNKHTQICVNCEETICNEHYSTCDICNKENKVCLKKCTFKCDFCPNQTTILCKKENHKNSYVTQYNCEHNICLKEIQFCFKCNSIVRSCPKCIVNYYFFHCNYCNNLFCNNCSNHCNKCEEEYCPIDHICNFCGKKIPNKYCLNCANIIRKKCFICQKQLVNLNEKFLLFCSCKCYIEKKQKLNSGKFGLKNDSFIIIKDNRREQISNFEYYLCDSHIEKIDNKTLIKYSREYDKKFGIISNEIINVKNKIKPNIIVKTKSEKCGDCFIF